MDDFSDADLGVLIEMLYDEVDRNFHEPGRLSGEADRLTESLHRRVYDEAKRRKLWWAR